jgi:hypothetical protein
MITATGISTDQVIYLDHQATTPLDPRVLDVMLPYLTSGYGNPSSPHAFGRQAAEAIRIARNQLRELIGASAESEVVFTSGATEANYLAITGISRALRGVGLHIITTAIEHKAVLGSCQHLAEEGFQVTIIPVKADGIVDPSDIAAAITPKTVLVSITPTTRSALSNPSSRSAKSLANVAPCCTPMQPSRSAPSLSTSTTSASISPPFLATKSMALRASVLSTSGGARSARSRRSPVVGRSTVCDPVPQTFPA